MQFIFIFDSKLTWNKHLVDIKSIAAKNLNLLKTLSHSRFGSDRKLLLRIHQSIILPTIEYGSFVYASASKTNLTKLDSIHRSGIRISTGAFRTSPKESLLVDSGMLPLSFKRDKQLIKFTYKVLSYSKHPLHGFIKDEMRCAKNERRKLNYQPVYLRGRKAINNFNMSFYDFYFNEQKFCQVPPWQSKLIIIDRLSNYNKNDTNVKVYNKTWADQKSETFRDCP